MCSICSSGGNWNAWHCSSTPATSQWWPYCVAPYLMDQVLKVDKRLTMSVWGRLTVEREAACPRPCDVQNQSCFWTGKEPRCLSRLQMTRRELAAASFLPVTVREGDGYYVTGAPPPACCTQPASNAPLQWLMHSQNIHRRGHSAASADGSNRQMDNLHMKKY